MLIRRLIARAPVRRERPSGYVAAAMDRRTIDVYEREARRLRRAAAGVLARAGRGLRGRRPSRGRAPRPRGRPRPLPAAPRRRRSSLADAAVAMLVEARRRHGPVPAVACDLEALAVRPGSLAGVWASKCLQHIPGVRLPLGPRRAAPGAGGRGRPRPVGVRRRGRGPHRAADDDFPDRLFTSWPPDVLADLLVGGGFTVDAVELCPRPDGWDAVSAPGDPRPHAARHRRRRACGCSCAASTRACTPPTPVSGFARPGNRFWPAALAAGIVGTDRSPDRALADHGVGHDRPREAGDAPSRRADRRRVPGRRSTGSAGWCRGYGPAPCASSGWPGGGRRSTGRPSAGVQPADLGGVPVYVMPSTSGLNARVPAGRAGRPPPRRRPPGRRRLRRRSFCQTSPSM